MHSVVRDASEPLSSPEHTNPSTHLARCAGFYGTRTVADDAVIYRAFLGSAVVWLLISSMLALIASIKLHLPDFFADAAWLTFGRIRPVHVATAVYGWAALGSLGIALRLLARLAERSLPLPTLLLASCVLWNLALLGGTLGILAGDATGLEYLELPPLWMLVMGAAMLPVVLVTLMLLAHRRNSRRHIAEWYLLAAILWFPFLLLTAVLLISGGHVRGMLLALLNWWYAHNLLGLFLVPIALATLYYFVPQRLAKPLYNRPLALFGFWTLAIVYHWAGMHHLIGAPVPAWVVAVSVAASVLMLVPLLAIGVNILGTVRGQWPRVRRDPVLWFLLFGVACFLLVGIQGAGQALRSVNTVTHFTQYTVGHAHLGLYGFVTMTLCGAAYTSVATPWSPAKSDVHIRLHFWTAAVGVAIYWVALTLGGIMQGYWLRDATTPVGNISHQMLPFLAARSIAAYVLLASHFVFAWNLWQLHHGRAQEVIGDVSRPRVPA